uniref:Uncharacterized protein n=1 Tax=viral metagenome TaxID=1070528 RepID=A0A6M3J253_9ZZZZ
MALYTITTKLMFPEKADADEEFAKLKAYLKNKDIRSLVEEPSFIQYIISHHDETPPQSCELIARLEK